MRIVHSRWIAWSPDAHDCPQIVLPCDKIRGYIFLKLLNQLSFHRRQVDTRPGQESRMTSTAEAIRETKERLVDSRGGAVLRRSGTERCPWPRSAVRPGFPTGCSTATSTARRPSSRPILGRVLDQVRDGGGTRWRAAPRAERLGHYAEVITRLLPGPSRTWSRCSAKGSTATSNTSAAWWPSTCAASAPSWAGRSGWRNTCSPWAGCASARSAGPSSADPGPPRDRLRPSSPTGCTGASASTPPRSSAAPRRRCRSPWRRAPGSACSAPDAGCSGRRATSRPTSTR